MSVQNYRANQFDPKNLMLFFGIAFGWTWLFNALFISGFLQMPADLGTSSTDFAAVVSLLAVLLPEWFFVRGNPADSEKRGMGMYLGRVIVESHGGTIEIIENVGCKIEINLPL